jgi:dihydroorotase
VLHVASAAALDEVASARAAGLDITAETCPQYLFLSEDDFVELGSRMKVYPPIRNQRDQEALLRGIRDGSIASVGSDHAPHTPAEKRGSLETAPAGIRGVDTLAPLMIDAWLAGSLGADDVVRVLAGSTAERFGVAHRKGAIEPGRDADLTIIDPNAEFTVATDQLYTLHPESVFEGRRLRGRVTSVVRHGVEVVRDGEMIASVPGRFVRAARSSS